MLALAMAAAAICATQLGSQSTTGTRNCGVAPGYARLPITFERNTGRYDKRVKFLTRTGGATVFLTDAEAVMVLRGQARGERQEARETARLGGGAPSPLRVANGATRTEQEPRVEARIPSPRLLGEYEWPIPSPRLRGEGQGEGGRALSTPGPHPHAPLLGEERGGAPSHVLRMKLVGASAKAVASGLEKQQGIVNYFIGNDPKTWRTNVPTYAKARFAGVYPGVDVVYYGVRGERGEASGKTAANHRSPLTTHLEYDFILHPGSDPSSISLAFEGAEKVRVANGDLILTTPAGDVRMKRPYAYQTIYGKRLQVACDYRLLSPLASRPSPRVAFRLAKYDASKPLVVDPVLVFSTFLSGAGYDGGHGIAVDDAGSAYVTGFVNSTDFPTTAGAWSNATSGAPDAFVTKLNADGSGLVYSTYLGGSGPENALSIAVDGARQAYVTGWTASANFPTTTGAFDGTYGGSEEAFVTKLTATGGGLAYSTFLGGSGTDQGWCVAVDAAGSAYVTGRTTSTEYPTTAGAFDTTHGGSEDAFVTKLNPAGSGVAYSTFLGSAEIEGGYGLAVDGSGCAYVGGITRSPDFPVTAGAFDTTHNGDGDAFVTKLNSTGTALAYSTFLGGGSYDQCIALVVDTIGSVYVTGYTSSPDYPVTPGCFDQTFNGGDDVVVTKLDPSGSGLQFSTFLGGSGNDYGSGIALGSGDTPIVAGTAWAGDFPTTAGSFDPVYNGGGDAYVTRLNGSGSALLYSTFLGGSGDEWGMRIAVSSGATAYVTGGTYSADFPVTAGAFDRTPNGALQAYVTKLDMRASGLFSWGHDSYGQLGLGGGGDRLAPTQVGFAGPRAIGAGGMHSLTIGDGGALYSAGWNDYGQLGLADQSPRAVLTPTGLTQVRSVATGYAHSLALTEDGRVYACGYNGSGTLGVGDTNIRTALTQVPTLSGVASVASGFFHSFAITESGDLYAWGWNSAGQLGISDTADRLVPTRVPLGGVVAVAGGEQHTLAVTADGRLYAWGLGDAGQLGIPGVSQTSTPTLVSLSNVRAVAAGYRHSLAVTTAGEVYAWGLNDAGQLGLGDTSNRDTPTSLGLLNVRAVEAGWYHALALATDGSVFAWGTNWGGQLGLGDTTGRLSPTPIPSLANVRAISSHGAHVLAMIGDNMLPLANGQSVSVMADVPTPITLAGSDADGDPLTYSIVTPPAHGTLAGTPPNVVYTNVPDYTGQDSFTFKVNDGSEDSEPATVSITVKAPFKIGGTVTGGGAGLPGVTMSLGTNETIYGTTRPMQPIWDFQWFQAPLTISSSGVVTGVHVRVKLTHTWIGDLGIYLFDPSWTRFARLHWFSGWSADGIDTTYADLTLPVDSLELFNGLPAEGTWWLCGIDNGSGDVGVLEEWGLALETQATSRTTTTDAGGAYTFDDLPAGTYWVQPSKVEWAFDPLSRIVSIGPSKLGVDFAASLANARLVVQDVSGTRGSNVPLQAYLTRVADGSGIEGRSVEFAVQGVAVGSATTVGSGMAQVAYVIPDALGSGANQIWASFAGDGTFGACTGTGVLTVLGSRIAGVVRHSGAGLPGVAVTLEGTGVEQSSAQVWLPIPDNDPAGVDSAIGIKGAGIVTSVSVYVKLTHTYIGALEVALVHPDGTTVVLHGGSGADATVIDTWYPEYTLPAEDLAVLNGKSAQGPWRLRVRDTDAYGDTGVFESWQLAVSTDLGIRSTTTRSGGQYEFADLPAGSYIVTPALAGYAFGPQSRAVSAPPDQLGQDFDATLNTVLDATDASGQVGQDIELVAALTVGISGAPVTGRSVTFTVDGADAGSAGTDALGVARVPYHVLEGVGSRTIGARFAGDAVYDASADEGVMAVAAAPTHVMAANAAGQIGATVVLSATLTRLTDGAPLTGRVVSFSVDGTDAGQGTTDASGVASVSHAIAEGSGAGDREISAAFAGDPDHGASSGVSALTVGQANTSLTVANADGRIGATVALGAILRRAVDGAGLAGRAISFRVDGADIGQSTTGATGEAALPYAIPEAGGPGERTIGAEFAGDPMYAGASGSGTLTAQRAATQVAVQDCAGTLGATVDLAAVLTRTEGGQGIEGRILAFSVEGTDVGDATTDASGTATAPYVVPEAEVPGVKALGAAFAGDASCEPSSGTGTLTVDRHPTALSVPDRSGLPWQSIDLSATLVRSASSSPIAGATVAFTVAGTAAGSAVTDVAGTATTDYVVPESFGGGVHQIAGQFTGDTANEPASGSAMLTVGRHATSLATADRSGTITENVALRSYDLKRTSDNVLLAGRAVSFLIDGTQVGSGTTDAGGDASCNWTISDGPATRTITAEFTGDAAHSASSATATLTAQTWSTKMVTFDRTARITDRTDLKARLLRGDNVPLYAKPISFYVDGTFVISRTTTVDGYASYPYYTVPNGAGAGARTVLCEWAGNGGYLPVSRTATLTVLKAIPYIWVLSKNIPYGAATSLYSYFRRLYDYQKQAGKTVVWSVDGTPIHTMTTDSNGVASFPYRSTEAAGSHVLRVDFEGDAWLEAGYGQGSLSIY